MPVYCCIPGNGTAELSYCELDPNSSGLHLLSHSQKGVIPVVWFLLGQLSILQTSVATTWLKASAVSQSWLSFHLG